MTNFYRAYGFTISSTQIIPALEKSVCDPATPELTLEVGPPPLRVLESLAKKVCTPLRVGCRDELTPTLTVNEYGAGRFFELAYGDGTRFLIDVHGARVWGEAGRGLTPDDVFVYFLGPIMGFLLRLRGKLALHASAVTIGGFAVVISGEAGAGKSTTAAALAMRGHSVICEDVCTVQDRGGTRYVVPGYPRIALWPDAVTSLFSAPDALPLIVQGWEKRYLALDGVRASFAAVDTPLCAIYLLAPRSEAANAPFIEPMSQRQAALTLVQNSYMNYLLTKSQRSAEFHAIASLVSEVECYCITAHADPSRLGDLACLVESHAANLLNRLESCSTHAVRCDVQP